MIEISLHLLDIVQNSIKAGAKNIYINIFEDTKQNVLKMTVRDDGCGMSKELIKKVADPFANLNQTRTAGLGLSLLKTSCVECGGKFEIESEKGIGTTVTAEYVYDSVDRQPLGDMAFTVTSLLLCNLDTRFVYAHTFNHKSFEFDSDKYSAAANKAVRSGEDLNEWLENLLNEKIRDIHKNDEQTQV